MPIGDFLEWLSAAMFVTAAALWGGLVLALAVAGACLFYLAQCLAAEQVTIQKGTNQ